MKNYLFVIMICCFVSGCTNLSINEPKVVPREIVMNDGMKICAMSQNNNKICIISEGNTKRIICIGEEKYSITLIPRTKRWHGKLGLIEPKQPENIFKTDNYTIRLLITEAQIAYSSVESSVQRLPLYKNNGFNLVYNDDGLLIMWKESVAPGNNVLDISIFQILIDGEKPNKLPGSQNQNIIVKRSGPGSGST